MSEYNQSFTCLEDLLEELKQMANAGTEAAIHISSNAVASPLDAYIAAPSQLIHFHVVKYELVEQFCAAMLAPTEILLAKKYSQQSFKPANSMNGKVIDTLTLPTILSGISLQLIFVEEWWQAMGGAHVADTIYIWLVHHEPLEIAAA